MPYKDLEKRRQYRRQYEILNKGKLTAYYKKYHRENAEKIRKRAKDWRQENPEKYRAQVARRKPRPAYLRRMSREEYERRLKKQKNLCDLCKQPFTETNPPVADHCHQTKQNRGLLHNRCNPAIGQFDESPELCILAAKYLKRWKKQ